MTALKKSPIKAAHQMRLLGITLSLQYWQAWGRSQASEMIGLDAGRQLAPDEDWLSWSGLNADNLAGTLAFVLSATMP